MPMVPFYTEFPDLAAEETRYAIVRGHSRLPDGEYAFLEFYCNEPGCDCRRVFINVISRDTGSKTLATINYGWESAEFYRKWASFKTDIGKLKGPALALRPAQQTELAPYLLELFKTVALEDEDYVNRLCRHYRMFKQAIEGKHRVQSRSRRKSSRGSGRRRRKKR